MPIAFPVTNRKIAEIAETTLLHIAPAARRADIVQASGAPLPPYANCRIHLKAGQGWSVAPFRLLRDYSVVDPYLNHLKSWGRYTYFFIGTPGRWAMAKNIGWRARDGDLGSDLVSFTVAGADLLACSDLLFHRPDDNVLVVRGDYRGPAWCSDVP